MDLTRPKRRHSSSGRHGLVLLAAPPGKMAPDRQNSIENMAIGINRSPRLRRLFHYNPEKIRPNAAKTAAFLLWPPWAFKIYCRRRFLNHIAIVGPENKLMSSAFTLNCHRRIFNPILTA